MTVLAPKPGQFARDYPEVVLDITTDDSRVDLVASGFDAGIQFGEFIRQDMTAVRVSPDHRPAIVGSPDYFRLHPRPKSPRDLLRHARSRSSHPIREPSAWNGRLGGSEPTCGEMSCRAPHYLASAG